MKRVVVTLTDQGYASKAKRTIMDIRSRGQWTEDLVLITVGFDMPATFMDFYRVIPFRVEHLDCSTLLEKYKACPIRPTCDNRQYDKLTQWDKFYVFDPWFAQWDTVLYVDAGLRVLDTVSLLMDLPCEGGLLAPDDAAPYDQEKRFGGIIETDQNHEVVEALWEVYRPEILTARYFLNCIWRYDTSLLSKVTTSHLVKAMNAYPICRCNEMTIMNLLFTFYHQAWIPFPDYVTDAKGQRKRLFRWTEHDRREDHGTTWRDFCFLKYPMTITFGDV
jgi:hypothetical protein